MSEEILINVSPTETRVAVIENGVLQEVHIERAGNLGLVGNIYRGKVVRIMPGLQAAFVDIGLEKTGFLHVGDIAESHSQRFSGRDPASISIRELLHDGQQLTVQVLKDPLGSKGARISTRLSVSSRYMVYVDNSDHIGVSQRIDNEQQRESLRQTVAELRDECLRQSAKEKKGAKETAGFIVRTVADGVDREFLYADMQFLFRLWQSVIVRCRDSKVPSLIYSDLPLTMRTMRDLVRPELEKIRIDSRESFEKVMIFAREFLPVIADKIEYYTGESPLFNLYAIEDEIQKALARKVLLKSGGYLIIDQTEAMTTIDVNTGAFVGHRNLEETIFKTNLEAASTLARQLRLRNLGGMIIIDFIDMRDVEHQRQVLRTLNKALRYDHAKISVTGISELGLVQMTRKRTRESLEHILCETCCVCDGRGSLKTAETVCFEIFREILREERAYENGSYLILASQSVIDRLLDEDSTHVADLEDFIAKTIRFQVETLYTQEQFDVVLL